MNTPTIGRLLLASGMAAIAAGLATPARAQQGAQTTKEQVDAAQAPVRTTTDEPPPSPATNPAPQTGDGADIVVTGFRASLDSALALKRNETGVIDAIKAEDIAQFPDLNLAESLQRIPGVAISRVNGEGRQISVRGLGSEYTRVRLNGMEAIVTTAGTSNNGGVNRTRGFDFNIFASELFNSLAVRKTASADVEEGSLGATVDLQTARPFDYKKPQLVVSAQASYNQLGRSVTPRLSALVSHNFLDERLGVLFSIAYDKRHLLEEGANVTRWGLAGLNGGFNAASTVPGYTIAQINSQNPATGIFHPRIPAYVSYDIHQKRLGMTGAIQFQPTDRTLLSIDGLYGYFFNRRDEAQLQAIGFSRPGTGKPNTIIRTGKINELNDLISGTFDNVDLRTQSSYDGLETKFFQGTADLRQEIGERLKLNANVGYANSTFRQDETIITFDRVDSQGYSYDFTTKRPAINLGFDPTMPANWSVINGTSEVRIRPAFVRNTFLSAKGFAEYKLADAITLKAGVDFRRFHYGSNGQYRNSETTVQTLTPAQVAAVSKVFSGFGRDLDMPSGNARAWLVPDIATYASTYNIYSNTGIYALTDTGNSSARSQFGRIEEKDLGPWAQADFRFDVGDVPLRGDIGLRRVHTDQVSTGYTAVGSTVSLVTIRRDYDRTLPSFNIAADLTSTLVWRFGAAKTIARPNIGSLAPGGDINVQGANRTFSRGNPLLDPTESKNLDVSLEWYRTRGALIGLGLFYKDISTFVQTLRTQVPYTSLGLDNSLLNGTLALPTDVFDVTQPVNSSGGKLRGFEINVQQPLSFLPGFLQNFGVLANYTYVTSNINYLTSTTPGAPTVNATLTGLSKKAWNGTLFYETKAFSVRGSVSHRSGYLTVVPGQDGNPFAGTAETTNVDAQATWNVRDNLKLTVEGINLTDEYANLWTGNEERVNVSTHSGRQFFVGLRYSF